MKLNRLVVLVMLIHTPFLFLSQAAENTTNSQAKNPYKKPSRFSIKFQEVKTISLGKARSKSGHGNVPWRMSGVHVTENLGNDSETFKTNDTKRFNYETLWNNGSLTLTVVRVEIAEKKDQNTNRNSKHKKANYYMDEHDPNIWSSTFMQEEVESIEKDFLRSRQKRRVFGRDSRIKIRQSDLRKIPFSSVVKISTGCTGTLISRAHVLTAAHCVHDGRNYIVSIKDVRVGFPKHSGKMKWFRVKYIKLPQGWTTDKDTDYDYAVLKLVHRHRRKVMYIGSTLQSRGHINTHFLGFHEDKPPPTSIWYSYCNAKIMDNMIVNRCDAMRGSSGAGVYILSGTGSSITRSIIGVFLGSGTVRFRSGRKKRFNVANKLTPLKTAQICSWAKSAPSCNALI